MTQEAPKSQEELQVLVFGPQAQTVGASSVAVTGVALPTTASDVLRLLAEQYSELQTSIKVSRLAVNQKFASDDTEIQVGDEVALIGLISGG